MNAQQMRDALRPGKGSKLDTMLQSVTPAEEAHAQAQKRRAEVAAMLRSAKSDAERLARSWDKDDVKALVEVETMIPALQRRLRAAERAEAEALQAMQAARLPAWSAAKKVQFLQRKVEKAAAKLANATRIDERTQAGELHRPYTERSVHVAKQELESAQWELERAREEWLASSRS